MNGFLKMKQKIKNNFSKHKNVLKQLQKQFVVLVVITPAAILIGIFLYLVGFNQVIRFDMYQKSLNAPVMDFALSPYPLVKPVFGVGFTDYLSFPNDSNSYTLTKPDISAQAALIIDKDSQVILFEKNKNLRFSMASTTKIMSALVALDYFKMDDILTIYSENVEGATVGFKSGEQYHFEDLLYAMMLPSANDAAMAIAQNYPGGETAFINKMNEKAHSFRLTNTNFSDPAGLMDDDYTTPVELARLASNAMNNKEFAEVVQTQSTIIMSVDRSRIVPIKNLNKLLGINGVNGLKTGFTEEAGEVLVTSKKENDRTLIFVVMKSKDRFVDTQVLLSLVSGNISYVTF